MLPAPTSPSPLVASSSRVVFACAVLIVSAVFIAWSNSLQAPFVLDDHDSIVRNTSMRALWPPEWLYPPSTAGETVSGRPVLNLSFALNRAVSGADVRGYRAVSVLLHALAALLVFGIVRRTSTWRREGLYAPAEGARLASGRKAPPTVATTEAWRGDLGLALVVALIWAVHPLQTAAVTYIVQRAEALAGLFYLLALYCFIRAAGGAKGGRVSDPLTRNMKGQVTDLPYGKPPLRNGWAAASVAAVLLGVGVKETLVTAPLVILLFDRTFLAGSFRAAWRVRRGVHVALFATWLPLAALVLANRGRGGSAGFASAIDPWTYLLTQSEAVVRYLQLVGWPAGQVFDYGVATVSGIGEVWPQCLLLAALAVGAAWALVLNRVAGFLGAAFFLLLAPSSSVVPIATQTVAEHRMYLALLVPVMFAGVAAVWVARRVNTPALAGAAVVAVALALGTATFARNRVYRSEVALWSDTVVKRPDNPRARHNLGLALAAGDRADEAMAEFRAAIALRPEHAFARHNLGWLLLERKQPAEAAVHFTAALEAQPDYPSARAGLGEALVQLGRIEEAETALRGVRLTEADPPEVRAALTTTYFALGNGFAKQRNYARALAAYGEALALDPAHVEARANLANCLLAGGRPGEAIEQYETVLRARPQDAAVRRNLEIAREMARRQ